MYSITCANKCKHANACPHLFHPEHSEGRLERGEEEVGGNIAEKGGGEGTKRFAGPLMQ